MSVKTIQCRLVSDEATRCRLWQLMADRNTPLINELLDRIAQHPDFEQFQSSGRLKAGLVNQLAQSLRYKPPFEGQPQRFIASAIRQVEYIYKSWLALQKRHRQRLEGKQRWLEMLISDEDLATLAGITPVQLHDRARQVCNEVEARSGESGQTPYQLLHKAYRSAKQPARKVAIAHLLKNGCCANSEPEDLEKLAQRRRKTEIAIERLRDRIASSRPKGRDLTGELWQTTLELVATTVATDATQAKHWQDILLTRPKVVPFPVTYETNEDLVWSKDERDRLCVRFNGISGRQFKIYCDRRQLHWFERFLADQQAKREHKGDLSSALFALRSGRIVWLPGDGQGEPWNANRLTLFCTLDTRLWTQEGTERVRREKAAEISKILTRMQERQDWSKTQQGFMRRKESTLARLQNAPPRPSSPTYLGKPNIIVGVSMSLEAPATVAAVDCFLGKGLTYRSTRQLLGKNFRLLNRRREEQRRTSHQRHVAQRHHAPNSMGESNLGHQVDRLLARAIVDFAQSIKAGSIALPNLANMREVTETEVRARAEAQCPGYLEGQKLYAKQYRISVHRWSYGRLSDWIRSLASQKGIHVEEGQPELTGTHQHRARLLALNIYNKRTKSKASL